MTIAEPTRGTDLFRDILRNPPALLGAVLALFSVFVVLFGPTIASQNPYDILTLDLLDAYKPPIGWTGSDPRFPLGTDGQGRDVLSSIFYGARSSAFIAVGATLAAMTIGTAIGIAAGWFGGWLDAVVMRIADVQLSFPSMLIALFLMSAVGNGADKVMVSLTAVGWVVYARTVRGATLSEARRDYVAAARVAGLPDFAILRQHILPNVLTPVIVLATIQVGTFILIEASLSFLGVGVPITEPSLGLLIKNGFDVLFSGLWWVSVFPGLMIMAMVFGINLLGDFLRDALNPRLR
ncbi:ABC transporter permease [Paracoccus suum]|uniref:ABC transporter permease n=1 Tax=Paracoccus suum TaxID=2259340 RepID=A0A344PMI5_9RHOB|nr:ABC transporter permease [Paracoccus suum]AXC50590.1 ABC transporter permease [Paracoccus suum]